MCLRRFQEDQEALITWMNRSSSCKSNNSLRVPEYTERNLFEILLNQPEIGKMVNTI